VRLAVPIYALKFPLEPTEKSPSEFARFNTVGHAQSARIRSYRFAPWPIGTRRDRLLEDSATIYDKA